MARLPVLGTGDKVAQKHLPAHLDPTTMASSSTADRQRANHQGVQAISATTGLQAALDAKATVPAGARNAVVQVSSAAGDARVGGVDTSYSVLWVTSYATAPTNLITDVDIWLPPAT